MVAADLAPHVVEARRTWPTVDVDEAKFAVILAAKRATDPARIADLYIVSGVALRLPNAARALQEAFAPALKKALLSLRLDAAQVDDALQTVWRDLLTGDAPRIAQYDGTGDLKAWLRVAATRIALRAAKKAKREEPDDEAADIADGAAADPELMLLKAKYRAHFHEAVKLAIENMPAPDAMILRQHFVDGLGIDQLGKLYDVHRSTAARRLESAREGLVEAIRVEFKKSARLADSEAESVLRLVRSSLDITLRRHFAAK